jgi:hypothetical protein
MEVEPIFYGRQINEEGYGFDVCPDCTGWHGDTGAGAHTPLLLEAPPQALHLQIAGKSC